jgi:transcriptional regulator with XRE-family HTH domain
MGADTRLAAKNEAMKKTNFDQYLQEQMRDPAFAERFEKAGEAWDVALQIASLRQQAGLSQKELARRLETSQQQVSRLESPGYEGHSLSMLRRVAKVLSAKVRVVFEPETENRANRLAEAPLPYRVERASAGKPSTEPRTNVTKKTKGT